MERPRIPDPRQRSGKIRGSGVATGYHVPVHVERRHSLRSEPADHATPSWGLSQGDLAKQIGTMGVVLGRYERDEVKPSIEVAAKIAQALGVSLDYLVGNSEVLLDKDLIKRITEIQQLSEANRQGIFFALDGLLRDAKARKAYA